MKKEQDEISKQLLAKIAEAQANGDEELEQKLLDELQQRQLLANIAEQQRQLLVNIAEDQANGDEKLKKELLEQLQQLFNNIPEKKDQELLQRLLKELLQFKYLLPAWTIAYETGILEEAPSMAKDAIDKASCKAVEEWTESLKKFKYIETIRGKEFDSIEDSINHHIDNLIAGGMWNPDKRPIITKLKDREDVTEVTVQDCTYKKGCEWGLKVQKFRKNGAYRCQRLGCFVGAVQKYMNTDKLSDEEKERLDCLEYLMTTVMIDDENGICKCKGLIFVNDQMMREFLLKQYPTQLP